LAPQQRRGRTAATVEAVSVVITDSVVRRKHETHLKT
jgi:hypothetical protein